MTTYGAYCKFVDVLDRRAPSETHFHPQNLEPGVYLHVVAVAHHDRHVAPAVECFRKESVLGTEMLRNHGATLNNQGYRADYHLFKVTGVSVRRVFLYEIIPALRSS